MACNAHAPYCHLWPAPLYNICPNYLMAGTIFEIKATEHKICILIVSTISSEKHLILRINGQDMIKMYIGLHANYPLFMSHFNETRVFSTDFRKHPQISNFMIIRPVAAELFHADGQTGGHNEESLFAIQRTCLKTATKSIYRDSTFNPYPTAFPYGNGMVLHFYHQQESSTTKTVHEVINKGLKTYV